MVCFSFDEDLHSRFRKNHAIRLQRGGKQWKPSNAAHPWMYSGQALGHTTDVRSIFLLFAIGVQKRLSLAFNSMKDSDQTAASG